MENIRNSSIAPRAADLSLELKLDDYKNVQKRLLKFAKSIRNEALEAGNHMQKKKIERLEGELKLAKRGMKTTKSKCVQMMGWAFKEKKFASAEAYFRDWHWAKHDVHKNLVINLQSRDRLTVNLDKKTEQNKET